MPEAMILGGLMIFAAAVIASGLHAIADAIKEEWRP